MGRGVDRVGYLNTSIVIQYLGLEIKEIDKEISWYKRRIDLLERNKKRLVSRKEHLEKREENGGL